MVDSRKKILYELEEKKSNSNLPFDKESNKISKDNPTIRRNEFDLDFLDWIIDKGWLRIKK